MASWELLLVPKYFSKTYLIWMGRLLSILVGSSSLTFLSKWNLQCVMDPLANYKIKNNVTIIYDCKYSQGDYSSAEVQRDVLVFRLGGSTAFNINPKTASGPSCSYFYILNLVGICTRKPAAFWQDTLQANSYTN